MQTTTLGQTGITVNKDGFGALPIQRASKKDAAAILNAALDGGINFIDTARAYSDSEEKIGDAISHRRSEFTLATKTYISTVEEFWQNLKTSLRLLKTDVIDIYQFHFATVVPRPGDGTGLYEAMQEAKQQGKIKHIGITCHRMDIAMEAAQSGLYETLQFPFSYLSGPAEEKLVALCRENNVGFIAMKALSGGLITDIYAARAFMAQQPGVVPIWGIQKMEELRQLIDAMGQAATLTPAQQQRIDADRAELAGSFCRGCGYCMPCPVGIEINNCARVSLFLRRAVAADFLTPEWQAKMEKTKECVECGQCSKKCPYELDTPALLKRNYEDYQTFI